MRENVVKIARRIIFKVVYEKYTTEIFYELACMPEFLLYTQEEREKKCPTFAVITGKEFREMCSFLKGELLRFLNSEFFADTFLAKYRIMLALNLSKLYSIENIRKSDLKIKICKTFFPFGESEEVKIAKMKDFILFDKISKY